MKFNFCSFGRTIFVLLILVLGHGTVFAACTIASQADINRCNAAILAGESQITISGNITCVSDGTNCQIIVSNQHGREVWVSGNGIQNSSITRVGNNCSGGVLQIFSSSQVRVTNFSIYDEMNWSTCLSSNGNGLRYHSDRESLSIGGSTDVQIGNIRIAGSQGHAVAITASTNVLLFSSEISGAGYNGILVTRSQGDPSDIRFVSNYIHDNFVGIDSDGDYVQIAYNTFTNNHTAAAPDGFGGGQVVVEGLSYDTRIFNNYIANTSGVVGVDVGIEIAPFAQVIEIHDNNISNNSKGGITRDYHFPDGLSHPETSYLPFVAWGNIWIHANIIGGTAPQVSNLECWVPATGPAPTACSPTKVNPTDVNNIVVSW